MNSEPPTPIPLAPAYPPPCSARVGLQSPHLPKEPPPARPRSLLGICVQDTEILSILLRFFVLGGVDGVKQLIASKSVKKRMPTVHHAGWIFWILVENLDKE